MRHASDPTFESIDTVQLLLDGIGRSLLDGSGIEWAVCELNTDHVIGTCGLHSFIPLGEAEVGCLLNRAYWGKGLMHDALRTLIGFARSDLHLKALVASIDDGNDRSAMLFKRLGFSSETRNRYVLSLQTEAE